MSTEPEPIDPMTCPKCGFDPLCDESPEGDFYNHEHGDKFDCPQCGTKLVFQEKSDGCWIGLDY